ncbi:DUF2796 domain-containing protein [uncultured Azonexus sp.]|uniref:DUF2796 domain-containing protein n=1 Tax=uncultured Azonexus sp. TaxID=520307 RepID=UPI00262C46C4|nr:DUF2796 domain-containing protein [uncultured Azonexus sp.]
MKKLPLILVALLPALALAHKDHAHSHGVGQLGIVVEGDQLTLLLEVPQHDLVGFERAPRNAREQLTVQAALEKLKTPAKLFTPTAAAQCVPSEQKIDAPLLEGAKGHHGHGDVEVRYVYRCAQPAALADLKATVSAEFPRVRSLNVSFAGPKGQKGGKLDAKNPVFAW